MRHERISTPCELPGPTRLEVMMRRILRRRRPGRLALTEVFRSRDFHVMDSQLDWVEAAERTWMAVELERYVCDEPGHVVTCWDQPQRVVMQLSDGRFMTLTGVSRRVREMLRHLTVIGELRPSQVQRGHETYRVFLRDRSGHEIGVSAYLVCVTT